MHEMSIAQAIAEIVCDHADAYREPSGVVGGKITRIRLRVGRYRAIVVDSLTFGLGLLLEETPASGAEVHVQEVPIRIACKACGAETELEEPYPICPDCDSYDVTVVSGKELEIESLEYA